MIKKRAIFLIHGLIGGGAERVCVNIANALSERDWDITLVVLTLKNSAYLSKLSDKIKIVNLDVERIIYAIFPLLKLLIKNKNTPFLVYNYHLTAVVLMLRSVFRLKIRIFTRNIGTLSIIRKHIPNFRQRLFFALINKFYCHADKIINQCYEMQEDLIRLYPSIENKCNVIHNPVDSEIDKVANSTKNTEKEKYILCVGRLAKEKAFHYAIKAFSLARPYLNENYYLKIVGEGNLEKELKLLTKDLKIESCVSFEGFQKEVAPYYLKAKATLLSSIYEGCPNVLIESITLGTPVISFACPSGPSEIINDLNGKLVQANDVEALSKAIIGVCNIEYDIGSVKSTSFRFKINEIITEYEQVLNS